jgi:hypothetical protein
VVLAAFVATSSHSTLSRAARSAFIAGGRWTLNRQQSELPSEVGFGLGVTPARKCGWRVEATTAALAARHGPVPGCLGGESDDAKRVQLLTAGPHAVLVAGHHRDADFCHAERRSSADPHVPPIAETGRLSIGDVPVAATTKREGGTVVMRYQVEEGRELQYSYTVRSAPRQLVVDMRFVERGGGNVIRRIYDPLGVDDPLPPPSVANPPRLPRSIPTATAPPTATPAPTSSAAAPPPQPAAPPPMVQTPDAELKGLARLGLVVEDLSQQAAACGLTPAALDAAVRQPLVDAGLKIVRDTDDDTYLYVNVITTRMPNGTCASRSTPRCAHTRRRRSHFNRRRFSCSGAAPCRWPFRSAPAAHAEVSSVRSNGK